MIDKMRKYYWVQKILPLVYDNSLSYYEMLCKIREKLNETIEQVNILEGRVDVLEDKVEELDERVTQCEEDIDGLEMRMDDVEEAVGNLDERVTECENDIDDLDHRVAENEENIDTLLDCCENVGNQIDALNDAVAGAVAATENLPGTLGTRGQVLTVNNDEDAAIWADVPEELPDITGNNGKFLSVNTLGTGVEWASVSGGGIPAISEGDAGKVLVVNSDEDGVEWATIQGGGGLPPYGASDVGKVLTVNSDASAVEWSAVDFDKITKTGTITFRYSDYSSADLDTIVALVNADDWTDAQLAKYDFNLDGRITLGDRTILSNMLTNQTDRTVDITTDIDPEKAENPIVLSDENDVKKVVIKPNEIIAPSANFGRVKLGDSYISEHGYEKLKVDSNEYVEEDPINGIQFYDSFGNRLGVYPPNAKRFPQDNDIGVNNLEGCAYWEGSQTGSDTYSLSNDHTYLLTFVRRNTTGSTSTGAWIIASYTGASNIATLKSTSDASVSVNGLSLTVTRNIPYWRITLTRLA